MSKQVRHALCLKNHGHSAALEVRKLYPIVADPIAKQRGLIRVVDESGEDYLYPAAFFVAIELPPAALKSLSKRSA